MVPAGGPVVGSRYDGISGAGQCQICPFLSFLEGRILEKWAVVEGQGIAPPEKARRRGANWLRASVRIREDGQRYLLIRRQPARPGTISTEGARPSAVASA